LALALVAALWSYHVMSPPQSPSVPDDASVPSPPGELRQHFHHELAALEQQARDMAAHARRALEDSITALAESDTALAASVIAGDTDLDRRYQDIEARAIELMGRQQPVASDLRLLVALIHVALHLERIGDAAVDVAEATQAVASLSPMPEVLLNLQEMGQAAASMTGTAVDAFSRRDRQLCEQFAGLDDRIDELDREMAGHVLAQHPEAERLEWALRMLPVSRVLERAADHAVDIAEQAWFLMTGELRELD
jgi:phosphate transport system protein